MDVSQWLVWYLERLTEALEATGETLSKIMVKAKFWELHKTTQFNERQVEMINKRVLLDAGEGRRKKHQLHSTAIRNLWGR